MLLMFSQFTDRLNEIVTGCTSVERFNKFARQNLLFDDKIKRNRTQEWQGGVGFKYGSEIMMEMRRFQRLRLKTRQERTLYSSLLGHNVSRKTSSLISLIRNSQLAAHSSSLAVFAVRSSWYASRALRFF